MKKILFLSVALLTLVAVHAQKVYFIYLQTDNSSPFFLRMGDKVYSSTGAGYLILSKLVDSTYTFTVGKAGAQIAETKFAVTLNQKDRGFLLKELDGTLSLFDLQTMDVVKPTAAVLGADNVTITKRTDGFSKLLSKAADDTTLLEVRVAKKTEKPKPVSAEPVARLQTKTMSAAAELAAQKQDTVAAESVVKETVKEEKTTDVTNAEIKSNDTTTTDVASATADTIVASKEEPKAEKNQETTEASVETPVEDYKRSTITRRSESSTSEGFGLVFLDDTGNAVDTIRLLIPNPRYTFTTSEPEHSTAASAPAAKATDTVVATVTDSGAAVQKEEVVADPVKEEKAAPAVKKTACKAQATDNDFLKLRRYMASQQTEVEMVMEAKKYFKNKCFSTEQVRNLSSLFLTAQGKYNFFDAAFTHVSDPEQFSSLESELRDASYIDRFKTLTAR